MYYVVSIWGNFVKNRFGEICFTGDILYQGSSLSEAIRVKRCFGDSYDVYSFDGNSFFRVSY